MIRALDLHQEVTVRLLVNLLSVSCIDPGQVDHSRTSVTKQYNLVLAGKIWHHRLGGISMAYEREMSHQCSDGVRPVSRLSHKFRPV